MEKINNSAIGDSWEDVKKELFTPEEIVKIETSAVLKNELKNDSNIYMNKEMMEMLLALFAKNDYPITYKDGSHGLGMGYGDFEKMLKKLIKE